MSKRVDTEMMNDLRSLILMIVSSVVDNPNEVEVNIIPAAYRLLAELHTSQKDVGQVIGKSGHVVESIRSIVTAFGGKHRIKVDLDYVTEQEMAGRR